MNQTVKVIDALPGSGKSTAFFKIMKTRRDEKWIYVSPLLSEIETRIQNELPDLKFVAPSGNSKTSDFLKLLNDGVNIACTHELFKRMGSEHLKVIKDQNYNLVLDEEVGAVTEFHCKKGDVQLMINEGFVEVEGPYSRISLRTEIEQFKDTSLREIAQAAKDGVLYTSKSSTTVQFLVTQIPVELLKCSKETYIITYMFEGSILERFLKLHNIDWTLLSVRLNKTNGEIARQLKEQITFGTTRAIDAIQRFSLSSTWYTKATNDDLTRVGNAWWSVARDTKDQALITTMPKAFTEKGPKCISSNKMRSVGNSYLSARTRATNDYADKNVVVHLYNRYPNANVAAYFRTHGISIDDNHFALSELIQFIFRSAVRRNEPITLYIASTRMRRLFKDWLDQVENEVIIE